MAAWDRRTPKQQAAVRDRALSTQVTDAVAPFSPFWRERLATLGVPAAKAGTADGLAQLPAVGERDVCPDGDPAGAAALVLQVGEKGFALHAAGPTLRKALARRLVRPGSYRAVVEADTRPTSYVLGGLAMTFPLASTRSDLDVVARAGARLWQVLGLSSADVLVSAQPLAPSAALQALQYAAVGASTPALFPGDDPDELAGALRLLPATVLALPSDRAAALLDDVDEAGAELGSLTTVLLVGAPDDAERDDVAAALARAGVQGARVLGVHVPDGHRLAWGECAAGSGLHTYPDLEVCEVVDPETGEARGSRGAEPVLTQLGMRGSALLRWRTGDLVEAVTTDACPQCGRTVPRVTGTQRSALVPRLALRSGERGVDLRGVAAALVGRPDLQDWRVVVAPSVRDGADELLVSVQPTRDADPTDTAVAVARDLRTAAGLLPTQVLVVDDLPGPADGPRVLVR